MATPHDCPASELFIQIPCHGVSCRPRMYIALGSRLHVKNTNGNAVVGFFHRLRGRLSPPRRAVAYSSHTFLSACPPCVAPLHWFYTFHFFLCRYGFMYAFIKNYSIPHTVPCTYTYFVHASCIYLSSTRSERTPRSDRWVEAQRKSYL